MKHLIFLIIPFLFLGSCSIDWSDEKLFEKKKYCAESKIEGVENSEIYQKFYSPKMDTCIYYRIEGTSHRLYNAFTNEFITGISSSTTEIESYKNFEIELKRLKGE